jgi:hypothetical protein
MLGQAASGGADAVLKAPDAAKMLPGSVFFRGRTANVQGRNAGGVKFSDGMMVLATLVDSTGYSSAIAEKYQGYLLVEVSLTVGGQTLQPGAYGFGFVAGDKFVVQDIGAHDVLTASSTKDAELKPAMPLQFKAAGSGAFRLYAGRSYVEFSRK